MKPVTQHIRINERKIRGKTEREIFERRFNRVKYQGFMETGEAIKFDIYKRREK